MSRGLFCVLVVVFACDEARTAPSIQTRSLMVGTTERTYELYVPKGAERAPVLMVFHGSGENARRFVEQHSLRSLADEHHLVLAAPQGLLRRIGGGEVSWDTTPSVEANADFELVGQVIDDLRADWP
jgi:poly(3-hydroxybutyrate) depolymerase